MRHFILFLLALYLFPFHLLSQEKPAEKADSLRFQRLDEADFASGMISNPLEFLIGKVPGVEVFPSAEPGGEPELRLRLGSPMSLFSQPLIVLDGLPLANEDFPGQMDEYDDYLQAIRQPLAFLNPADIASVTVLKDAEATARYGHRGSNGVILIESKAAQGSKEFRVRYQGGAGISQASRLTPVLSPGQFRELIQYRYGPDDNAINKLGLGYTDWQQEIFQTGSWNNHHVSLEGGLYTAGGKLLPYRVSAGYTDERGMLKTARFQRLSTDVKLAPSFLQDQLQLKLGLRTSWDQSRLASPGAMYYALRFDPTQPVYDPEPDHPWGGYTTYERIGSSRQINTQAPKNPLALLEQVNDRLHGNRTISQAALHFSPDKLPFLRLNFRAFYDEYTGEQLDTIPKDAGVLGLGVIYTEETRHKNQNLFLESWVDVEKKWGNMSLKLTEGAFYQKQSHKINYFSFGGFSSNRRSTDSHGYLKNKALWTQASLAWKDVLTLSGRRSFEYPFFPSNRAGGISSLGFSWKLLGSPAAPSAFLKLRAGYSLTNSHHRPDSARINLWAEKHEKWDVGLDYAFFQQKLWGSLSYFHHDMSNLLNWRTFFGGPGTPSFYNFGGDMKKTGVELQLVATLIQQKSRNFSLGINLTVYQNEVTRVADSVLFADAGFPEGIPTGPFLPSATGGVYVQTHSVGHPAQSFYLSEQVYDALGLPIEGVYEPPQANSSQYSYVRKNKWPTNRIGFFGNLAIKNWELSFISSARLNYLIYNQELTQQSNSLYHNSGFLLNTHAEHESVNFLTPQYQSDHFLQNASFFRLDNLRLAYRLPNGMGQNRSVSFAFISQNLFTLTNFQGRNPDIPRGIDESLYPVPRNWVVEVIITPHQ